MKASNSLQLLACGVLFALVAAILLFVLALSTRTAAPQNPNGMGAHLGRIAAMNAAIAGEGRQ